MARGTRNGSGRVDVPAALAWKVISLPFRGPRPTLKGEEPLQLRLMDDIVLPQSLIHPDRPPYACSRPSSYSAASQPNGMHLAVQKPASPAAKPARRQIRPPPPAETGTCERIIILALKSSETYEVTRYQRDGDLLMFEDADGRKGGVDVSEVDWRKTTEMTTAARSTDKPLLSRQTN